jgi:hypothetical protein
MICTWVITVKIFAQLDDIWIWHRRREIETDHFQYQPLNCEQSLSIIFHLLEWHLNITDSVLCLCNVPVDPLCRGRRLLLEICLGGEGHRLPLAIHGVF